MSANATLDVDSNAAVQAQILSESEAQNGQKEIKSMDHHRQMLQAKLAAEQGQQNYVSPSDTIMSPCTAKLSALKNKHTQKAKPRSLFAKTAGKNLESKGGAMFGDMPSANKDVEMS